MPSPPELRNQAEGKPSSEAENGRQKPRLFADKVPAPTYNMAQDDYEQWKPLAQKVKDAIKNQIVAISTTNQMFIILSFGG